MGEIQKMLDVERVENKLLINAIDMEFLKERLGVYLKPDSHNGDKGYRVRSVYFDSNKNFDYFTKEDGLNNRKKIRIRIYPPDYEHVKLELKEKNNGKQRKRSVSISKEEALCMLRGDYGFLFEKDCNLAKALCVYMTKEIYRPKCIVEYDRYAFIHDVNDIRVTFDSNLRCSMDYMRMFEKEIFWIPADYKSRITMEVKYNNFLLSGVKNAISNRVAVVVSSSKYCKAREKLKY